MLETILNAYCHADDAVLRSLGWTPTSYAIVSSLATGALAWGVLAAWYLAFGTLRRAGFSRRMQRIVWWFLAVSPLVQIALILLKGSECELVPCPWQTVMLIGVALLFIAAAYGMHKQDQNKASGLRFVGMIALPVLGEVSVTAKVIVSAVVKLFFG